MRSSRSAPDPLDPGPAGFAHRGLHAPGAAAENSLTAFAAALEVGAGIECDLRLTADDRILVFHDADASRLCGSPAVIGRSKAAELAQLRVAGQPIPTLASLLQLVGGRVPLLLEVKVGGDLRRWVPALRRELPGYAGPLGVMTFDPRLGRLLKTRWPAVRRGLVLDRALPGWKRRLYLALADPAFLAVNVADAGEPWVARAQRRMPVYSWTVRTAAQRARVAARGIVPIWEGDGRP